jgi:hypothetical protein
MEKRARSGTPYKSIPGPPHEPPGTKSQSVPYFLMGVKIALSAINISAQMELWEQAACQIQN